MVADVSSGTSTQSRLQHADGGCGEAREVWHNQPDDRVFTAINRMMWADGHIVFPLSPVGDEFDRYYSISLTQPSPAPVMLTTTDGLIEDATSAALSADGRTLYYTTNATDIEKRPLGGPPPAGAARRISTDDVSIAPATAGVGKQVPCSFQRRQRRGGTSPSESGTTRVIFPTLPKTFPVAAHVTPETWCSGPPAWRSTTSSSGPKT